MEDLRIIVEHELNEFVNTNSHYSKIDPSHGISHFITVANHSVKALEYEDLPQTVKIQIELAALLHDVDDRKLFPGSVNYQNARDILEGSIKNINEEEIGDKDVFIQGIIDMIDLVSCFKNGDSEPPEMWMAIPRDCDRLTAIGQEGIDRCKSYTNSIGSPLHTEETKKVYTKDELYKVATHERFIGYQITGKSVSMIDHYYDKLLHIGKPECLRSQNKYILEEAARRNHEMEDFVIRYWIEDDKM